MATATGTYSTKLFVFRTFGSQNGTEVDCSTARSCALTLWLSPSGATVPTLADTAPLSFSK